jgi:hypothetical protein
MAIALLRRDRATFAVQHGCRKFRACYFSINALQLWSKEVPILNRVVEESV